MPLSRDYFPQEKKSVNFEFKREKKWVYNMLDPKSAEYKTFKKKCKVRILEPCCRGSVV